MSVINVNITEIVDNYSVLINEEVQEINVTVSEVIETTSLVLSEQGSIGLNGKSAYEIAIQNGFIGTEQEWLESIKQGNIDGGIIF